MSSNAIPPHSLRKTSRPPSDDAAVGADVRDGSQDHSGGQAAMLEETICLFTKIAALQVQPSPLLLTFIGWMSELARLQNEGLVCTDDLRSLEPEWRLLAEYLEDLSVGAPAPGPLYSSACRAVLSAGLSGDCTRLSKAIGVWLRTCPDA